MPLAVTRYIEELTAREIEEIEQRMRPGRFSRAGFLGPDESLPQVIEDDARVLRVLGVTHRQIANRIVEIAQEGRRCQHARPPWVSAGRPRGHWAWPWRILLRWHAARAHREGTLSPVRSRSWMKREIRRRQAAWRALGDVPWGLGYELDGFRLGLEGSRPLLLPSGFGFSSLEYMGFQLCPFQEPTAGPSASPCGMTDSDFLIANPRRQEWIVFSGLLPHLIADHHFFEGRGTVYRLDPELTVRVLELNPAASDARGAAVSEAPGSTGDG